MPESSTYPTDWQPTVLGALADYINGYPFKPRDWTTVGIPIVRIAQMTDPAAAIDYYASPLPLDYCINNGDLLFSWSATLLALIWRRGPAYLNQHIYKVVAKNGNDIGFLHHLLNWLVEPLANRSHGTTMKHITRSDLLPFPVMVPLPSEQSRIAAVLDTVDEAIAKTEAVIVKLKQVRASLLHDFLTRGFDEHGQLRDPIAHPEQFNDSPLGRIPREWEVVRLGGQAQFITSGSRGWARYYSDEGALFLRIGNLTRERIDLRLEDVVRVRPPLGSEGARTRVQSGDVLISITADLGIIGVIPELFEEAYVNQHIALVRPVQGVCPRWIGRYLSFGPTAMLFRMLNDTGAKAGMNLPSIESLLLAIPTHEEQDHATTVLDAMDTNITEQLRFAAKLQHLKSALMSDLLTGRVRVPADIFKENP